MFSDFLIQAFVTLFVIIDPIAVIPAFISLTRSDPKVARLKTARKACLISFVLLILFALGGDKLLDVMSISEPAFRIAGGFLMMFTAIEMVVAKSTGLRSTTGEEQKEAIHKDDVSVFPLAIPLIAGPGALTSVVVLTRQAETINTFTQICILVLIAIVIGLTYLFLHYSQKIMDMLGVTGTNVLTRVFGVILSAVAIQSILNGIHHLLLDWKVL